MDCLRRQARYARKREHAGNSTPFVLLRPLRLRDRLAKITFVFHRGLEAGEIQFRRRGIEIQAHRTGLDEAADANLRLFQQLRGPYAIARRTSHKRRFERVVFRSNRARRASNRVPALVVNQPDRRADRCQPEIGVVDSQKQAMLRPGREHPVRLEASARDEIVDEDADVCLVASD